VLQYCSPAQTLCSWAGSLAGMEGGGGQCLDTLQCMTLLAARVGLFVGSAYRRRLAEIARAGMIVVIEGY